MIPRKCENYQTSPTKLKKISWLQFFLTFGQNNFRSKTPFPFISSLESVLFFRNNWSFRLHTYILHLEKIFAKSKVYGNPHNFPKFECAGHHFFPTFSLLLMFIALLPMVTIKNAGKLPKNWVHYNQIFEFMVKGQ